MEYRSQKEFKGNQGGHGGPPIVSAWRHLSQYPRDKKIVIEISTDQIKRVNKAGTLDEIISEAQLDYALGKYSTHKTVKVLWQHCALNMVQINSSSHFIRAFKNYHVRSRMTSKKKISLY